MSTWAAGGRIRTIYLCRWARMSCGDLDEMRGECCRLMRESIQYALDHREEALNYALQFARDMDPPGRKVRGHVCQPLHGGWRGAGSESRAEAAGSGVQSGLDPNKVQLEVIG